jgi:hypothetical protein
MYLTGATSDETEEQLAGHPGVGLMVQPGNGLHARTSRFPAYAADNGCYALRGAPFDQARWVRWLDALPRPRCLFAAAPDVLLWPDGPRGDPRGDAAATLAQADAYLPMIRQMGFPAALVLQDGMTAATLPWGTFDAVFVGGSTPWKMGPDAHRICTAATARGVHVHMGRVNTRRRLKVAASWACDTVDGTMLAFGARKNLPPLLRWLDESMTPQLALPPT